MKNQIKNYRNTIALFLMLLSQFSFGQVGIGTSSPNSESVLDLSGDNSAEFKSKKIDNEPLFLSIKFIIKY